MDNSNETLQFLKGQEKSRILTGIIVKAVLATIAGVALIREMPLSFTNVVIACLIWAVVYDLCCIYQFSLRLTGNYIVALFVAAAILGGIFYLYSAVLSKMGLLDKQYSLPVEHILSILVTLVLLIPLMLNIRSVIRLSQKAKND